MKELQLEAKRIEDSRGRPTVQVVARLNGLEGKGDVPAGASKGEDEAATVDVEVAVKNVHDVILPLLRASSWDLKKHADLVQAERAVVAKAGDNFKILGANAVVPTSRALWQLAAKLAGMELWSYLRKHEPAAAGSERVSFYMNIFNGGLHALKKKDGEVLGKDRIDIQEIMVVPVAAARYAEALLWGEKIDAALKRILIDKFGDQAVTRADEAGFSVKGLGDSSAAFALVFEAIKKAGFEPGRQVKMALDVAASSFFDAKTGKYQLRGDVISSDEMRAYLSGLVDKYPGMILSIEDGLAENDWAGWTKHSAQMHERQVLTIGDDLFVTQLPRLEKGIATKAAHAILIKVNQNGSMTGTLDVIKHAKQHGMKWVVSHRSGETLDDSIADLAFATGALGLKTGDPQPERDFPERNTWVRRAKYLRMVAIEKQQ
ncbi:MAG: phosphopyruvate hydratase [Deltaproteobacteria bacterium]|nr:phosphopyruvate hydratase [Deltaproteobacteria bacterium]